MRKLTKTLIYPVDMLSDYFYGLWHLFFPRQCALCGAPLLHRELCLCMTCDLALPRTGFDGKAGNRVERLFWGKIPVCRATSYFHYHKEGACKQLLFRLKYYGRKEIGTALGQMAALELMDAGFFQSVDVIVPVPLHAKRLRQRGYNQSEYIARGLAKVTRLPVEVGVVERRRATESQTQKSVYERWDNMNEVFRLTPEGNRLCHKHVLLADDVLTTGATTTACAHALLQAEGCRVSIFTLAVATD